MARYKAAAACWCRPDDNAGPRRLFSYAGEFVDCIARAYTSRNEILAEMLSN